MGTWHSDVLTPFLHDSIILQLTANEADRLFLLLISNTLPQKPHLSLRSPNYSQHISILELMHPSTPIGTSGMEQFWGEKRINSNIMTKIVLRHLAFPLISFCSQSPLTLTFILKSIISSFHLCHNAEKEAAKSKGRSALKKNTQMALRENFCFFLIICIFLHHFANPCHKL